MKPLFLFFFFLNYRISAGPEPQYDKILSGYKIFKHKKPFYLKYGNRMIPELEIAYETWGTLNEKKDNAVMVYTGLSASSHAKSHKVGCYMIAKPGIT